MISNYDASIDIKYIYVIITIGLMTIILVIKINRHVIIISDSSIDSYILGKEMKKKDTLCKEEVAIYNSTATTF